MPQVLTAYGLLTGQVLWLTEDSAWSPRIRDARVSDSDADMAEMEAAGKAAHAAHEVFDIYRVDIAAEPGPPRPIKMRERIRAIGPTIHPGFGPQAEEHGAD